MTYEQLVTSQPSQFPVYEAVKRNDVMPTAEERSENNTATEVEEAQAEGAPTTEGSRSPTSNEVELLPGDPLVTQPEGTTHEPPRDDLGLTSSELEVLLDDPVTTQSQRTAHEPSGVPNE